MLTRKPTLARRALVPVLALVALCLTPALALASEGYERWYVVKMNGEKTGWMHETLSDREDGHIVSGMAMQMTIGRMGQEVSLDIRTEFVETEGGEPVSMYSFQDMGVFAIETTYTFDKDGVDVTTVQMGREVTRREALPAGEWLTPNEAHTFVRARLNADAEEWAYRILDAGSGLTPIGVRQRVVGDTKIEVMGKTVPAIECEVQQSVLPGTSREYVDAEGLPLLLSMPLGGMKMEILASSEAIAKAEFDAPEMMSNSFVRVDPGIDRPRSTTRAAYLLRYTGEEDLDLADAGIFTSAGVQRVERVDESSVRVTVDLDNPARANIADDERAEALSSSTYIDTADEAIIALTREALKDAGLTKESPRLEIAEALQSFVDAHVEGKQLGVGFATASEVCRTREGDCSEHGMLLAAMLRVAGIPSRVVTGLVYADGFMGERRIFGYHMWTQALIEVDGAERWIDFDAAIRTMDATHIAITRSTLADDDPVSDMLDLISVFGSLAIDVESVE